MSPEDWDASFAGLPASLIRAGLNRAWRSPFNSRVTRSSTPVQSPGVRWRNSRAVGYQGVVSIRCIQRQSLRWGSRIHTGFPMAPAR